MQIFDPSVRSSTGKASGARGMLLLPIAASLVLAGCGGGSSTSDTPPPPPVVCTATDGGGSGFALGVCTDPLTYVATSAFQPIDATVVVGADSSYALSLSGPAKTPNVAFTLGDSTRNLVKRRDVIGAVRGEAYEKDSDPSAPQEALPVLPYTALVDFRNARNVEVEDEPTVLQLQFANFGHWEQVTVEGSHFGGWYAKRSETAVTNDQPSLQTTYSGVVVGVLSPAEPGARSYGFSATVSVVGDSTGVRSGKIEAFKISYTDSQDRLVVRDVSLNSLAFRDPINLEGDAARATLDLTTTSGVASVGEVQARFFGSTTSQGAEIAGRLRFQTADGMRGVGAFGARAVPGG